MPSLTNFFKTFVASVRQILSLSKYLQLICYIRFFEQLNIFLKKTVYRVEMATKNNLVFTRHPMRMFQIEQLMALKTEKSEARKRREKEELLLLANNNPNDVSNQ